MNNEVVCKNCKEINENNSHYCKACGKNLTYNIETSDILGFLKTIAGIGAIITLICLFPDLLTSFTLTSFGGKPILLFFNKLKPILFVVLTISYFLLKIMHKFQLKKNLTKNQETNL